MAPEWAMLHHAGGPEAAPGVGGEADEEPEGGGAAGADAVGHGAEFAGPEPLGDTADESFGEADEGFEPVEFEQGDGDEADASDEAAGGAEEISPGEGVAGGA